MSQTITKSRPEPLLATVTDRLAHRIVNKNRAAQPGMTTSSGCISIPTLTRIFANGIWTPSTARGRAGRLALRR